MTTNDNIHFHSNGKLLITGEYLVLDGAKALAIPTRYGQSLSVESNSTSSFVWKSYDEHNRVWFEHNFTLDEIYKDNSTKGSEDTIKRLYDILKAARQLNPDFLNSDQGYSISTKLDFNKAWGLGTSSTLINNIALWAKVNPYQLLNLTFGGSGYDIACAESNLPILYQRTTNTFPSVKPVDFNPPFSSHLCFVYLNKKKNSREAITQYNANKSILETTLSEINAITNQTIVCTSLEEFKFLMKTHEAIISKIIQQETIQNEFFNDFNGQIKSLGAWGGDFILAASEQDPKAYFLNKGFTTILPYSDMVL